MQGLPFFWSSSEMRLSPAGFAWLVLAWLPGVQAATWFDLYNPVRADKFTIEVDLDSLRLSGARPELLARIRFEQVQRGTQKDFQAVIARIEVNCLNRELFWRRIDFYADTRGTGQPIASERNITQTASSVGRWLPDKAKQVLQQSICGRAADSAEP
jgi:hypothetical protein